MVAVSVIIPVYNAEKYLSECVESLLNQTLVSCEFIFVNDGSTDASQAVVEAYAQKDSRIQIIHQINQGVSIARNTGIQMAKGDYITFVDADDFIDVDYLEQMYQTAIQYNALIVVANFKSETDGKWLRIEPVYECNKSISKEEIQHNILPIFLKNDSLNSCCVKLFNKHFIHEQQLQFPVGMANGEDALFCLKAFSVADTIIFINSCGYSYRSVSGSASRSFLSKDYLKIALENYDFDHQKFANLPMDANLTKYYKSRRFIDNIYDLIHIYLRPSTEVSWIKRVRKVGLILNHSRVQEVFRYYGIEIEQESIGYRKLMLQSIRKNRLVLILGLTFYSNFRNHYYCSK